MNPETEDIDWQAAEWAVKADSGQLTPDLKAKLDSWIAADPRHQGAYLRAQALLCALADPDAAEKGAAFASRRLMPALTRRRMIIAGSIAASLAALAIVVGFGGEHEQTFATLRGQITTVPLPDGSELTLNTDSAVVVKFGKSARAIKLDHGEVLFKVAKDKARPFVVSTRGTQVRAVGTSFVVSSVTGRPLQVTVQEGVVRFAQASAKSQKGISLSANSRLVIEEGKPASVSKLTPEEVEQALSWRSGHIFLQHQSLAYAAAEFGRYNETAIVIDDPAVAKLTVSGLFAANDPVGFARAAALALGLNVVIKGDEVHLLAKK